MHDIYTDRDTDRKKVVISSVCKPCHERISANFRLTIFVEVTKSAKFVALEKRRLKVRRVVDLRAAAYGSMQHR